MYIQVMKPPALTPGSDIVALPCVCANLRRAARIVSQRYDQYLRPSGLKGTQFTLLQALAIAGNAPQGRLGAILGLDSTTLTRTLALLRAKGWVQAKPGKDRRQIRLSLSAEGKRKYQRALHHWQSAQNDLRRVLGEAGWKQIMDSTRLTAVLVQRAVQPPS